MFFARRAFAQTKNIACFVFVFRFRFLFFVFGFVFLFYFFALDVLCTRSKKCSCDGLQTGKQCSAVVMKYHVKSQTSHCDV